MSFANHFAFVIFFPTLPSGKTDCTVNSSLTLPMPCVVFLPKTFSPMHLAVHSPLCPSSVNVELNTSHGCWLQCVHSHHPFSQTKNPDMFFLTELGWNLLCNIYWRNEWQPTAQLSMPSYIGSDMAFLFVLHHYLLLSSVFNPLAHPPFVVLPKAVLSLQCFFLLVSR